jgi:hypothetical protein
MVKKSELEALHNTYRMFAGQAAAAVRSLALGSAIDHAIHSLYALPGYANYETRYAKAPHVALPTLAVIFDYSPALFRSDAMDCVATLLVDHPKLSNKLGRDLALELKRCRLAMAAALRDWDRCSGRAPHALDRPTALTGDPKGALKVWARLGLLAPGASSGPATPRPFTATLSGSFEGICPRCGVHKRAPKLAMLTPLACGGCAATVEFVILRDADLEVQAQC